MKKSLILVAILGLALTGAACSRRTPFSGNQPQAPVPGNVDGASVSGQTQTLDCFGSTCPEISIKGDSYASSAFHGYADPTIRKDPTTGRLWLAYSWPNTKTVNGQKIQAVESHLAYSDDNGKTWQFNKVLWPTSSATNQGGNNEPGYMEHEVPNLLPVVTSSGVVWYGAREDYFIPTSSGYEGRASNSFQIRIFKASSPEELSNAPYTVLGAANTASGWNVNVNLSSLSSSLSKCQIWNETALYYENNTLYFATRCLAFNGRTPDNSRSDLVVFSTSAQGDPANWKWQYAGILAGSQVAQELGSSGVTQIDFAKGTDGKLLAIITPDDYSTAYADYIHYGCVAVEMSSINPPTLARGSNGKLKVRAKITDKSSIQLGPGACTYDPASTTGMILTRRIKDSTQFSTSLRSTGIKP